eukprot:5832329-Pyramimonas_sp.AAC.1
MCIRDSAGDVPSGHRHRGRRANAKQTGRRAKMHARAGAAAKMHHRTPSTHGNCKLQHLGHTT